MVLSDSKAVVLFVCFYKLLFLGTDFANKMLKIKLENSTKDNQIRKIIIDN